MSTIRTASRKTRAPKEDPFRLGWRYVDEKTADGEIISRQVPLTDEDVLHPQEGDFIVNTPLHDQLSAYLKLAIKSRFPNRPDVVVLGDTRIDWGSPYGWIHGPDVAEFEMVQGGWSRRRGTFRLKNTGGKSLLNIEVTSPSTRDKDFGAKLREYFLIGVPVYVIVDIPDDEDEALRLFAYQAGDSQYEPMAVDAKGRVWLECAGLWLGTEGTDVFLEDSRGNRLPEYQELAEKFEALQKEVNKAEKARKSAEKARKSAEKARESAEKAREKAEQNAVAEAKNRQEADKRIVELEKELARLRSK